MKKLQCDYGQSYIHGLFKAKRLIFVGGEAPKVKVETEEKKEKSDGKKVLEIGERLALTKGAVKKFIDQFEKRAAKDPALKAAVEEARADLKGIDDEKRFSALTNEQKHEILDSISRHFVEASLAVLDKKVRYEQTGPHTFKKWTGEPTQSEKPKLTEAQKEVLGARVEVNNLLIQAQEAMGKTQGRPAKLPVLDALAIKSAFDNGIKNRNAGSEEYDKGNYSGAITGYASALARFQDVISQCNRFLPKEEKLPMPWKKEKSPDVAKLEEKPKKII